MSITVATSWGGELLDSETRRQRILIKITNIKVYIRATNNIFQVNISLSQLLTSERMGKRCKIMYVKNSKTNKQS